MIKLISTWLKYRKHPCYVGFLAACLDHDLVNMQDSQGDGLFTATFEWVECERCGETHNDNKDIPELPEWEDYQ